MRHIEAFCLVLVVMVSCGGESDCRLKEKECATGFVCENDGGKWECVKAVETIPLE